MAMALFVDEEMAMLSYEDHMKRLYPRKFAGLRVVDWCWVPEEGASFVTHLRSWWWRLKCSV